MILPAAAAVLAISARNRGLQYMRHCGKPCCHVRVEVQGCEVKGCEPRPTDCGMCKTTGFTCNRYGTRSHEGMDAPNEANRYQHDNTTWEKLAHNANFNMYLLIHYLRYKSPEFVYFDMKLTLFISKRLAIFVPTTGFSGAKPCPPCPCYATGSATTTVKGVDKQSMACDNAT